MATNTGTHSSIVLQPWLRSKLSLLWSLSTVELSTLVCFVDICAPVASRSSTPPPPPHPSGQSSSSSASSSSSSPVPSAPIAYPPPRRNHTRLDKEAVDGRSRVDRMFGRRGAKVSRNLFGSESSLVGPVSPRSPSPLLFPLMLNFVACYVFPFQDLITQALTLTDLQNRPGLWFVYQARFFPRRRSF